jgi:hypothetical protein
MEPWPQLPTDVVSWFHGTFATANRRICERLVNVPNIRETSLDDGLIEALIPECAPLLLPSGAVVRMDAHNIGGLRRFMGSWEAADIAILIFIYRRDALIAKKIGLLQSKRLYPENNDVEDDDRVAFAYGMNAFIRKENTQAVGALHRSFSFAEDCIYGAIQPGSEQIKAIDNMNEQLGPAIYYLLYNPHILPVTIDYPLRDRIKVADVEIGCRVVDASNVHKAIAYPIKTPPSHAAIRAAAGECYWPLEVWAADLLLTCQVGQQFDDSRDQDVQNLLERRSGPIGAALAVSITLPGS